MDGKPGAHRIKLKQLRLVSSDVWQWLALPAVYVIGATTKWQAVKAAAQTIHHDKAVDLIPDQSGDAGTAWLFRCRSQCYVVRASTAREVQAYVRRALGRRYPLSFLKPVGVGWQQSPPKNAIVLYCTRSAHSALVWECGHCGRVNPQADEACVVCGCPASGQALPQSQVSDFTWRCQCGHNNPGRLEERELYCLRCYTAVSRAKALDQVGPPHRVAT